MKKLLGIVVLGLLLSGNAFSFNFKQSLNDYKKQNTGVESDIYMMNRCSAVFNWQASNLIKSNEIKTSKFYLSLVIRDSLKHPIKSHSSI